MNVVQLAERRSHETIQALKFALSEAEAGRLRGSALALATTDGKLRVLMTDALRRNPHEAMGAAARMCLRVSMMLEEDDGWPLTADE